MHRTGSGLVMRRPPVLELLDRDRLRALQFERPSGEQESFATWYHTITFPDGEVTPGIYDHRELVPHYGLPDDLGGKRALDVATANGFWAFEMEQRGAVVTAVDVSWAADLDFPPQVGEVLGSMPPRPLGDRFREAHSRLGSSVTHVNVSVYELDAAGLEDFDFVHAGDLLLHLERPLQALRKLHQATARGGRLLLSDVVNPALASRHGHGGGLVEYHGGWEGLTWWVPSVDALGQLIVDAGFVDVEPHLLYMLPTRNHDEGPWRAVFRARR